MSSCPHKILPGDVRPSVCDECPVASGAQSADDFRPDSMFCHGDITEKIEPPGICRGLALANGWISDQDKPAVKLSPAQADALKIMLAHEGALEGLPGGFWTWKGCPDARPSIPAWYTTVGTIKGLVKRELVEWTRISTRTGLYNKAGLTKAGRALAATLG